METLHRRLFEQPQLRSLQPQGRTREGRQRDLQRRVHTRGRRAAHHPAAIRVDRQRHFLVAQHLPAGRALRVEDPRPLQALVPVLPLERLRAKETPGRRAAHSTPFEADAAAPRLSLRAAQLASAIRRACSRRCSAVIAAARARPPKQPLRRPACFAVSAVNDVLDFAITSKVSGLSSPSTHRRDLRNAGRGCHARRGAMTGPIPSFRASRARCASLRLELACSTPRLLPRRRSPSWLDAGRTALRFDDRSSVRPLHALEGPSLDASC